MGISVQQDGGELVIRVKVDAEPADTLVAIAATYPAIGWDGPDKHDRHARDIVSAISIYMIRWRAWPQSVRLMPDGLTAKVQVDDITFGTATLGRQKPDEHTGQTWKVARFTLTAAGRKLLAE